MVPISHRASNDLLRWHYLRYMEELATVPLEKPGIFRCEVISQSSKASPPSPSPLSHFLMLKKEQRLQGCCRIPGSISRCNSGEPGREAQQVWSHYRGLLVAHRCSVPQVLRKHGVSCRADGGCKDTSGGNELVQLKAQLWHKRCSKRGLPSSHSHSHPATLPAWA